MVSWWSRPVIWLNAEKETSTSTRVSDDTVWPTNTGFIDVLWLSIPIWYWMSNKTWIDLKGQRGQGLFASTVHLQSPMGRSQSWCQGPAFGPSFGFVWPPCFPSRWRCSLVSAVAAHLHHVPDQPHLSLVGHQRSYLSCSVWKPSCQNVWSIVLRFLLSFPEFFGLFPLTSLLCAASMFQVFLSLLHCFGAFLPRLILCLPCWN